jgi:hypothetical protein
MGTILGLPVVVAEAIMPVNEPGDYVVTAIMCSPELCSPDVSH